MPQLFLLSGIFQQAGDFSGHILDAAVKLLDFIIGRIHRRYIKMPHADLADILTKPADRLGHSLDKADGTPPALQQQALQLPETASRKSL